LSQDAIAFLPWRSRCAPYLFCKPGEDLDDRTPAAPRARPATFELVYRTLRTAHPAALHYHALLFCVLCRWTTFWAVVGYRGCGRRESVEQMDDPATTRQRGHSIHGLVCSGITCGLMRTILAKPFTW